MNLYTQVSQLIPSRIHSNRYISRHIVTKMLKNKSRERILEAAREIYKRFSVKITLNVSSETTEAVGKHEGLKEKKAVRKPQFQIQGN